MPFWVPGRNFDHLGTFWDTFEKIDFFGRKIDFLSSKFSTGLEVANSKISKNRFWGSPHPPEHSFGPLGSKKMHDWTLGPVMWPGQKFPKKRNGFCHKTPHLCV